jgi:hypothetical protein
VDSKLSECTKELLNVTTKEKLVSQLAQEQSSSAQYDVSLFDSSALQPLKLEEVNNFDSRAKHE